MPPCVCFPRRLGFRKNMNPNKFVAYQETRLLNAQPGTQARIALEESLQATRRAIVELKAGNAAQRSRAITRAMNLLTEFAAMLNDRAAPDVCLNLRRLTDYAHHRLLEAHSKRSEAMMTEVIRLLQPIVEAWATVERRSAAALAQR